MPEYPVPIGHESAITVFIDEEVICGVIQKRTGSHTVECDIYSESDELVGQAIYLLSSAVESLKHRLYGGDIGDMIRDIQDRLRREMEDEAEGDPPTPSTHDTGDIPF